MGNLLKYTYITAPSLISSIGFSVNENMQNIRAYKSGIGEIDDKDIYNKVFNAARIDQKQWNLAAAEGGLNEFTPLEQLFILTLRETIRKSGINPSDESCCLVLSTTKGNIERLSEDDSPQEVLLSVLGDRIATALGLKNKPIIISNACISGVSALIVGRRMIAAGEYKHILVAGGDLLNHFVVSGFDSFKSLSATACRPFDQDRDGLSLGEACGSVLLTTEKDYVREKEPIVLESGAITNDANHISGPSRTGDGLYMAISETMTEAGLSTDDISFLNVHGTGTAYNDEMESKAVTWAGLQNLPLNSLKSYWGHTLGASGIIETIACMEELLSGEVFGTFGYKNNGVPCALNISEEHRSFDLKRCIKTASGFGGCNAAISLALEKEAKAIPTLSPAIYKIKSQCLITNGEIKVNDQLVFKLTDADFPDFIRAAYKDRQVDDRKFYKMDDLCKLGYMATTFLLTVEELKKNYNPEESALIFANRSSSLDTDKQHQTIIESGTEASPAVFVYTLPNVVMGELCIRYGIKGENTFFIQDKYDETFLMDYASLILSGNKLKACLIGWCELVGEKYEARFSWLEKTN